MLRKIDLGEGHKIPEPGSWRTPREKLEALTHEQLVHMVESLQDQAYENEMLIRKAANYKSSIDDLRRLMRDGSLRLNPLKRARAFDEGDPNGHPRSIHRNRLHNGR